MQELSASHDPTRSCSPFETPMCVPQNFFLFASNYHHPSMNFLYSFLLLLVVLSAYSESPQHTKPPDFPDPIVATVCSNSSSAQLGILAPVLPQNEVFITTPPHNEVYKTILPQNEVFKIVLPQNGVYRTVLPQKYCKFVLAIYNNMVKRVQKVTFVLLNLLIKLPSILICDGEKLVWALRITLESLQHPLRMYTWSLSENQSSVNFRCRITGLFLKRSFFRKHDFAVCVHKMYQSSLNLHFWHLGAFLTCKNNLSTKVAKESFDSSNSNTFGYYGGGKALVFSSDELLTYVSVDLHEQQYQFIRCIKQDGQENQIPSENDDILLCNVPLEVLAPKLTLKCAKELATLHKIYMPSKILLQNAQILLKNHKCHHCNDFLALFKPFKISSNADHQKTWYQKNKEKRAEYNKHRYPTSEYRESNKKLSQKNYWSKKDVKFPPSPPLAKLCQTIVSDFAADTSPEVFEEAGCAICGKLTPICEMEELFEVENINLLKVDGVTRKARSKNSDPVRELKGPVLASHCNKVCPVCVDSLDKKKMPTLALANGLWIGDIPSELQDLTYAEQLLIAKVRHNRCIVKVSSGMFKMRANAISFSNPMPKIYNVLPPPIEEMDEVLAFIYTGPCKPTKADFQ